MTKYINLTSQFHQFNPIRQKPQFGTISNPRIFNFSKTTKLIKLNYKNHHYSILEQKPIDQYHQNRFQSSKTPIYRKCRKYPQQCMKNAWKQEIKCKRKGKKTYRPSRTKTLQKSWRKTTKNRWWSLTQVREREKFEKLFEKVPLKSPIWLFRKHVSRVSIDRKTASIDRNRQRLYLNNLKQVRSIENQFRSIETDRGSLYQILKFSIDRKTDWINQNGQRLTKFEETQFLKKTFRINSKHWNLRTKCISMRWYDFHK